MCTSGSCSGTARDCSSNNLPIVATCNNNPDNNPLTWDFAPGFTSTCDEANDRCTTGTNPLTHTCDKARCGAECVTNADCASKCVGSVYYSAGACGTTSSCSCSYTTQDCSTHTGWYNTTTTQWVSAGQCAEKQQLKQEYRNYGCSASGCTYTSTSTRWIDTGNLRNKVDGTACDDGLFCTVSDHCSAGVCHGAPRDCSQNNIPGIATCDNNPDNNPFTWDYAPGFVSQCVEGIGCTKGVCQQISHTCSKVKCGAECETNADCNDNNPTTVDTCTAGCTCTHTYVPTCGDGIINPGEQCELPNTINNLNCPQSTTSCNGKKQGTRDAFGNCNSACGCTSDPFTNFQCVKGQCGAECSTNADCNDNNPHTTDTCTDGCTCTHTYVPSCGDGIINPGEQCELPNTLNNTYCAEPATTCSGQKLGTRDAFGNCNSACGCDAKSFTFSCVADQCGAECSAGQTQTQSCGSAIGECKAGTQTRSCSDGCTWGDWSQCTGATGPSPEICDGKDNNCNGQIDEGDVCGLKITSMPITQQCLAQPSVSDNIYRYQVTASSPDDHTLTYSLVEFPAGMTIDSSTGLIEFPLQKESVGTSNVIVKVEKTGFVQVNSTCPEIVAPVCAKSGDSFRNICELAAAGQELQYNGYCYQMQSYNLDICKPGSEIYPRQKYEMEQLDVLNEEPVCAGDTLTVLVSLANNGIWDNKDIKMTAVISDLAVEQTIGPFRLNAGDEISKRFNMDLPADAEPGMYDVRVYLYSDSGDFIRILYREFQLTQCSPYSCNRDNPVCMPGQDC